MAHVPSTGQHLAMAAFGFESTTDDVLAGVDLTGTQVVITGVSTGLGLETARALCRADLASLASVRAATDAFVADGHDRIDVLIANAGIMGCPQATTADGFEMQFGTTTSATSCW